MPQRQPEAIFVPFETGVATTTTEVNALDEITFAGLETAGVVPSDPTIPQIFTNTNTLVSNTAASLEVFDHNMIWTPKSTGRIVKLFINIGMIGDMSAFTDETVTWDTTRIFISEVGTGKTIYDNIFPFGGAIFNAADEVRLEVFKISIDNQEFEIKQGATIRIRLITTHTQTTGGTDPTYVTGVTQLFPITADLNQKFFTRSGIVFYVDRTRESYHE